MKNIINDTISDNTKLLFLIKLIKKNTTELLQIYTF